MATKVKSGVKGKAVWFYIAGGLALLTAIVMFMFLNTLTSTQQYYVLNQDLPARTLVTPQHLTPITTSSGGEPRNALTATDVRSKPTYTKIELKAGDIITTSNAGDLVPLRAGLPDDFVIASFLANPNDAAGGNIKRGDYVDVFLVTNNQAQLIFQKVLILDTTTTLSSSSNRNNEDQSLRVTDDSATAPYRTGIPSLYTVGLSQEHAVVLSLASQNTLYIVLSSADTIQNGATDKFLGVSLEDLLSASAPDAGKNTDNTFPGGSIPSNPSEPGGNNNNVDEETPPIVGNEDSNEDEDFIRDIEE